MQDHEIATIARMTGMPVAAVRKVLALVDVGEFVSPLVRRRVEARQAYESGSGTSYDCVEAAIESATRVRVTQDVAQAYMDAPGAVGGGLRAAFTAAGFEVVE